MTKKKESIKNPWQLVLSVWDSSVSLLKNKPWKFILGLFLFFLGITVLQIRSCSWDGCKPVIEKEPLQFKNPFKGEEHPQRRQTPPIPDIGK